MARQINKKYAWIIIAAGLATWILLTPSHFQKGGVDADFYFIIAFFTTIISILITLLFDKFHPIEKIFIAFPIAVFSLFLTTILFVPIIIDLLYGDKTWFFEETKHRIFINFVYYGMNAIIMVSLSTMYFTLRKQYMNQKELHGSKAD